MQNYTKKPDKPEPTKEPSHGANQTDTRFMQENPILFFVLEYGALLVANYCGFLLGVILCIIALIGGYRYRQLKKTHGTVMMVLAIIMMLVQF